MVAEVYPKGVYEEYRGTVNGDCAECLSNTSRTGGESNTHLRPSGLVRWDCQLLHD